MTKISSRARPDGGDRRADARLVAVGGGGVDVAVAGLERLLDRAPACPPAAPGRRRSRAGGSRRRRAGSTVGIEVALAIYVSPFQLGLDSVEYRTGNADYAPRALDAPRRLAGGEADGQQREGDHDAEVGAHRGAGGERWSVRDRAPEMTPTRKTNPAIPRPIQKIGGITAATIPNLRVGGPGSRRSVRFWTVERQASRSLQQSEPACRWYVCQGDDPAAALGTGGGYGRPDPVACMRRPPRLKTAPPPSGWPRPTRRSRCCAKSRTRPAKPRPSSTSRPRSTRCSATPTSSCSTTVPGKRPKRRSKRRRRRPTSPGSATTTTSTSPATRSATPASTRGTSPRLKREGRAPPSPTPTSRARPDAPGFALQYWFFWYFNQFNDLHEGDWEGMQITFEAVTTRRQALREGPSEIDPLPARRRRARRLGRREGPEGRHAPGRLPGRGLARDLLRLRRLRPERPEAAPASAATTPPSRCGGSTSAPDPAARPIPTATGASSGSPTTAAGASGRRASTTARPVRATKTRWHEPFTWMEDQRSTSPRLPGGSVVGPTGDRRLLRRRRRPSPT